MVARSRYAKKAIWNALSAAHGSGVSQSFQGVFERLADRCQWLQAVAQKRGDGRRQCAAGSMVAPGQALAVKGVNQAPGGVQTVHDIR